MYISAQDQEQMKCTKETCHNNPGPSESERGGEGREVPPKTILSNLVTLSQPGGQIIPTTLLLVSRIFRPSYGPVIYRVPDIVEFY